MILAKKQGGRRRVSGIDSTFIPTSLTSVPECLLSKIFPATPILRIWELLLEFEKYHNWKLEDGGSGSYCPQRMKRRYLKTSPPTFHVGRGYRRRVVPGSWYRRWRRSSWRWKSCSLLYLGRAWKLISESENECLAVIVLFSATSGSYLEAAIGGGGWVPGILLSRYPLSLWPYLEAAVGGGGWAPGILLSRYPLSLDHTWKLLSEKEDEYLSLIVMLSTISLTIPGSCYQRWRRSSWRW